MEQIDLKQLVEQYPEVLMDSVKLKAYILDLYPQCKRGMVNILVAIQQCGIVAEMQASKNPSALDMSRWERMLDDNCGFAGASAKTCLQMWGGAVGIQLEINANIAPEKVIVHSETIQKNNQSKSPSNPSNLQNSQKDWFEYRADTIIGVKEEHRNYSGTLYIPYGYKVLNNCNLPEIVSIVIPNGIEKIGDFAFSGCFKLEEITIPETIKTLDISSFEGCPIKKIFISDLTAWCNISWTESEFYRCYEDKPSSRVRSTERKGYDIYLNGTRLTNLHVPDGVVRIEKEMFFGCSSIENIILPESVQEIKYQSFAYCTELKTVVLPKSATRLGDNLFLNCCNLETVVIPLGVEFIVSRMFSGCTNLRNITIPNSVISIGESAFSGCTALTCITIPDSIGSIGDAAFGSCKNLKEVHISNIAKWCSISFGSYIYSGDYQANPLYYAHNLYLNQNLVTDLVIPNDVKEIEAQAFINCTSLVSITIPDSVRNIGDYAFAGCTELTLLKNPDIVPAIIDTLFPWRIETMRIGSNAFSGCTNLLSVAIPAGSTSIGEKAFSGCAKLTSITIPESVTTIGDKAFEGCPIETANIPMSVVNSLPEAKKVYEKVKLKQAQKEEEARKLREQERKAKEAQEQRERKAREEKERKERELAEARRREEQKRLEQQRLALEKERREKGVCQHCGGEFKGLFIKKCAVCGQRKDY